MAVIGVARRPGQTLMKIYWPLFWGEFGSVGGTIEVKAVGHQKSHRQIGQKNISPAISATILRALSSTAMEFPQRCWCCLKSKIQSNPAAATID